MIGQVEFNYYSARGGAQFLSFCHHSPARVFCHLVQIGFLIERKKIKTRPGRTRRETQPVKVQLYISTVRKRICWSDLT